MGGSSSSGAKPMTRGHMKYQDGDDKVLKHEPINDDTVD